MGFFVYLFGFMIVLVVLFFFSFLVGCSEKRGARKPARSLMACGKSNGCVQSNKVTGTFKPSQPSNGPNNSFGPDSQGALKMAAAGN